MNYSISITERRTIIHPLLGDNFSALPHIFDFSSTSNNAANLDTTNFDSFQSGVFGELNGSGKKWGIGSYLEERRLLLRNYRQIIDEGRFFHVGLDVIVPGDTPLYAPIHGRVYSAEVEEGQGNYGGYVILEHNLNGSRFFSFYGHLNSDFRVKVGDTVNPGDLMAIVGARSEHSGGWFTHTHLQIITEKAMESGRAMQGYISAQDLPFVETLFPSPHLLFRY